MSSSTDERKIPKIVLKIGGGSGSGSGAKNDNLNLQETVNFDSIYSTKAPEVAKEFFKIEANANGVNSISLQLLLKKINQNSYKSIENVLEL